MFLLRKSVFEFFLQLDEREILVAFSKDNASELLDMVFGSLVDDEQ